MSHNLAQELHKSIGAPLRACILAAEIAEMECGPDQSRYQLAKKYLAGVECEPLRLRRDLLKTKAHLASVRDALDNRVAGTKEHLDTFREALKCAGEEAERRAEYILANAAGRPRFANQEAAKELVELALSLYRLAGGCPSREGIYKRLGLDEAVAPKGSKREATYAEAIELAECLLSLVKRLPNGLAALARDFLVYRGDRVISRHDLADLIEKTGVGNSTHETLRLPRDPLKAEARLATFAARPEMTCLGSVRLRDGQRGIPLRSLLPDEQEMLNAINSGLVEVERVETRYTHDEAAPGYQEGRPYDEQASEVVEAYDKACDPATARLLIKRLMKTRAKLDVAMTRLMNCGANPGRELIWLPWNDELVPDEKPCLFQYGNEGQPQECVGISWRDARGIRWIAWVTATERRPPVVVGEDGLLTDGTPITHYCPVPMPGEQSKTYPAKTHRTETQGGLLVDAIRDALKPHSEGIADQLQYVLAALDQGELDQATRLWDDMVQHFPSKVGRGRSTETDSFFKT